MKTTKYKVKNTDLIDYKRKIVARRIVQVLIAKKELDRPSCCDLCFAECKPDAHHVDYGKPADVIWLCSKCHGKVHRSTHPLNPNNNTQTMNPMVWDEKDYVTVNFNLPVENFIVLKKLAEERGVSLSKILRGCVLKAFPVEDNQLYFFEVINNEFSPSEQKRISVLEHSQECVHKQLSQKVLPLRVKGHDLGERMEQLSNVSGRHGDDAPGLRWSCLARQEPGILQTELQMGQSAAGANCRCNNRQSAQA